MSKRNDGTKSVRELAPNVPGQGDFHQAQSARAADESGRKQSASLLHSPLDNTAMKKRFVFPCRVTLFSLLVMLLVSLPMTSTILAQPPYTGPVEPATPHPNRKPARKVCADCIRAHEEFLASDAMQGRGSGTHDELVAATYIGAELRAYGIAPAGDDGGYIQSAPLFKLKVTATPTLEITPADGSAKITWSYGKEFLIRYLTRAEFSGPLQRLDAANPKMKIKSGAIVFVPG